MNSNFIRELRINWDKISEDSYLQEVKSLRSTDSLCFPAPVTFFAGENGSGKSTLLEAIAIAAGFNPEGGSKNYSFSTYDSHSELHDALTLIRGTRREQWGFFLRAESFYNVATMEEEYSVGSKTPPLKLHKMSHGQSFMKLISEKFTSGLFILDEPEAALSPAKQFELLAMMKMCVENGSQFLIASHSPILLGYPEADIIDFDKEGLPRISYEDTDSYVLTKSFLNNRERILAELLK